MRKIFVQLECFQAEFGTCSKVCSIRRALPCLRISGSSMTKLRCSKVFQEATDAAMYSWSVWETTLIRHCNVPVFSNNVNQNLTGSWDAILKSVQNFINKAVRCLRAFAADVCDDVQRLRAQDTKWVIRNSKNILVAGFAQWSQHQHA